MPNNFHESFAGSAIKPPSERSTGLMFAGVALIVALIVARRAMAQFGGGSASRPRWRRSV